MSKIDLPSEEMIYNLIHTPLSDEEMEELEKNPDIQKLIKAIKRLDPIELEKLQEKFAYPNNDYINIPGQRDIQKWVNTVKNIYIKQKDGMDQVKALKQYTFSWDPVETYDFINWLRYYQQGNHMKYKTAQNFYGNLNNGYMLPLKEDPILEVKESVDDDDNKKEIIKAQRTKILKRLDSAEKVLREHDIFPAEEFQAILSAIYDLKRKIQSVNKTSKSTKLYSDMIYRQGNILSHKGFNKGAEVFYTLAQDKSELQSAPTANIPNPTAPVPPTQGQGVAGGLPSMGPGMPQNPPESAPNDSPTTTMSEGMKGFLDNLSGIDDLEVNDESEVNDELYVDDLITTAQLVEPKSLEPKPLEKAPPVVPISKPEIEKPISKPLIDSKPDSKISDQADTFSNKMDAALANVKVIDVINQLEDIAKVFKIREIPRQLSFADMMLDKLGMASFFPALSEAINKSLESNNYISTRIEDVLSKLRGAMERKNIDLKDEGNKIDSDEILNIKKNLQTDIDKEKARKDNRKEQEFKEIPEIEIEEDLGPEGAKKVLPKQEVKPIPVTPKSVV
jgi:hypothetical protein